MKFKRPRGTTDRWHQDCLKLDYIRCQLTNLAQQYGFEQIATPLFETAALFCQSVGDHTELVQKQMFTFSDKKGRPLALRPEGTASVLRALIEPNLLQQSNLPVKLFYWGAMFRYERPQRGRYRQFWQYGIEVIHEQRSLLLDIEVLKFGHDILTTLGLKNYVCQLNFLPSGAERARYVATLRTKLQTLPLCDDCQWRIKFNPLRVLDCKIDQKFTNQLPSPTNFLSDADAAFFQRLQSMLQAVNLAFVLNPFLVRGLDYYNGLVFEFVEQGTTDQLNLTLIGGGHYDELATALGSKQPYLALGLAVGIERLLALLPPGQCLNSQFNCVLLLIDGAASTLLYAWKIAKLITIRQGRVKLEYAWERKLKNRLKPITTHNCQHIIFVGQTEVKTKTVTLKLNQVAMRPRVLKWKEFTTWLTAQTSGKKLD